MDFSIKCGLACLTVGLACARTSEQLIQLYQSNRRFSHRTASAPPSLINPIAGLAALAYAHSIGADRVLLAATWLHTVTASATVLISTIQCRRREKTAVIGPKENNHG